MSERGSGCGTVIITFAAQCNPAVGWFLDGKIVGCVTNDEHGDRERER